MRKLPTILSLLLLALRLSADSAVDYFDRGAQSYVFGDHSKALREINLGLALFPDDTRLQRMAKLLQQEDQPQKSPQSKQEKSEQQKNQEQQQEQQSKPHEPKPQEPQQQKQSGQGGKEEPKPGEAAQPEQARPGQMTAKQAEQLLDAQKGEERALIFLPPRQTNRTQRPFKDW